MTRVQPAKSWSELEEQFRAIENQASTLFRGVDPGAALPRPRPRCWIAVECLAHLNLSIDPYFPLWLNHSEKHDKLHQAKPERTFSISGKSSGLDP